MKPAPLPHVSQSAAAKEALPLESPQELNQPSSLVASQNQIEVSLDSSIKKKLDAIEKVEKDETQKQIDTEVKRVDQ